LNDQGWKVQEANGDGGPDHIEEVLGEIEVVDKKLELEKVFSCLVRHTNLNFSF